MFKKILQKYLPENLISSQKIGFGAPVDYLIKSDLKNWATDLLSKENNDKEIILWTCSGALKSQILGKII